MTTYILKLWTKLKLDEYEVFKLALFYLVLIYFNQYLLSIILSLFLFLIYRKYSILMICIISFININLNHNKFIVQDVKENYAIISYGKNQYFTKYNGLNFYDEIEMEYEIKRLEDNDFNQFLFNRNITETLIIKKVNQIKSSNHLKSLLYRYINQNFSDQYATFLLSVVFNYKISNFIFYSLHFHVLTLLLIIKKRSRYFALIVCGLFLMFDFKLIVLLQLLSILLSYTNFSKSEVVGIQIIIVGLIFNQNLFSISFIYFLTFKILSLFYYKYKLNRFVLLFYSILFFNQISIFSFLFYRKLKYIVTINFLIITILIWFPHYCKVYINFVSQFMVSDFKINHSIPIITTLILFIVMFNIKAKKSKLILYCILLIPNHFYIYQEIIFIPKKNEVVVIIKENHVKLPIILNNVDEYSLNKYGIQQFNVSGENVVQNNQNALVYLNDYFIIGKGNTGFYKNIPFDYYVTNEIDLDIIEKQSIKNVIYFNDNDTIGMEELKLLERKIPYISINKTVKIIYFLGFRFIVS